MAASRRKGAALGSLALVVCVWGVPGGCDSGASSSPEAPEAAPPQTDPERPRAAMEAEARGYLSHVFAEFPDGTRVPLTFYDPVRLPLDLGEEVKLETPFIAEPGLIVVERVVLEQMERALEAWHQARLASPRTEC